jgi:hypothetical protein
MTASILASGPEANTVRTAPPGTAAVGREPFVGQGAPPTPMGVLRHLRRYRAPTNMSCISTHGLGRPAYRQSINRATKPG